MGSHSDFAPSASSRWLVCSGSIELIKYLKRKKKIPENRTNDAAELGTAVHYIVEQVLLGKRKISYFRWKSIKCDNMTKSFKMTSKELFSARKCVKYAHKQMRKADVKMFPERKYDLSKIYGVDIGGTSDITIVEKNGTLEITDYKNGKWPVEVDGNTQLRIYALGAYYAFDEDYDFQDIKMTVVQPNCNHKDGIIRSENITVEELIEWERGVLVPVIGNVDRGRTELIPDENKQCTWCDAKSHCPARKANKPKLTSDVIGDVIPSTDINTLPEVDTLTDKELESALQNADKVIKFYTECKKQALARLEDDVGSVSGWGLVPKLGNRTFKDIKQVKLELKKKRIKVSDITLHEDRLMSVTELEKYLRDDLEWDKDQLKVFMDDVTKRTPTGHALKKVESAEDEFAEFAKLETKKPRRKKRRTRRK